MPIDARSFEIVHAPEHEHDDPSGRQRHLHEPPHGEERTLASHRARQRHRAVLDESPGDVRGGTVRAEILRGDETLLDPAVQPTERAHLVGRLAHGPMPATDHDGERGAEVDHEPDRESPVEHGEHDDHAGDHECGAERLGHDETQELRHRRDVAVDALDQFARRVPPMELVVEPEHVAGHVESKLVGGRPRGGRRPPGDEHGQHLSQSAITRKSAGERAQFVAVGAGRRPIDEATDDERTGEHQHRRGGHEQAECGPSGAVGPEERAEGAPPGLRSCLPCRQSRHRRPGATRRFRSGDR